jgi:hypothetical protein
MIWPPPRPPGRLAPAVRGGVNPGDQPSPCALSISPMAARGSHEQGQGAAALWWRWLLRGRRYAGRPPPLALRVEVMGEIRLLLLPVFYWLMSDS